MLGLGEETFSSIFFSSCFKNITTNVSATPNSPKQEVKLINYFSKCS